MSDYLKDFSLDPDNVWLNVASEGPIPNAANDALQAVIRWKLNPHLLTIPKFQQVPLELKKTIAKLLHAASDDVILGNSATYGIHLLANGIKFNAGDEIILLQNDFPTDILPWLSLQQKGVVVHQLKAGCHVLTPEEIKKAINARTKLVCLPLVHSFSGFMVDIPSIARLCREHGILLVVNLSQAAGSLEIDLSRLQADAAVGAGYKWLLGPYGTGYCWIHQRLREQLNYPQNYWISLMDEASLMQEGPVVLKDVHTARRYDVFGTANFFNFVPWNASIMYLLSLGLERIKAHNDLLVDGFIEGLDLKKFRLISPYEKSQRTHIVVFSCAEASKNQKIFDLLKARGFYLAFWKGYLRLSPHIYNSTIQIQKLLEVLNGSGI